MARITYMGTDYDTLCSVEAATAALAPSRLAASWGMKSAEAKTMAIIQASRLVWSFAKWANIEADTPDATLAAARIAATQPEDAPTPQAPTSPISAIRAGNVSVAMIARRPEEDDMVLDAFAKRLLDRLAGVGGSGFRPASATQRDPIVTFEVNTPFDR